MNARVSQLFEQANQLEPDERSFLAIALLDSVSSCDDADQAAIEQSWVTEARRRSEAIQIGAEQAVAWAEVKATLLAI